MGWLFIEFVLAVLSHLLRMTPTLETLEAAFMSAVDQLLPMFVLRFFVLALAMMAGVFSCCRDCCAIQCGRTPL